MATITEDYVSFETALLLKKKGFNEPCFAYYSEYWDNWKSFRLWKKFPKRSVPNKGYLNVPTLQMAMKWLREVHNTIIIITPFILPNDNLKWIASIRTFNKEEYYLEEQCIVGKYNTYEEAAENAIKCCLEKLI